MLKGSHAIELYAPFDLDEQELNQERREELSRVRRALEVEDFKWLMAHKPGRRIVWRLLTKAGVYRSSFSTEPLEMAFLEGQRNDGLSLMGEIFEHAPDRYADMLKEARDARSASGKPGTGSGASSSGSGIDPRDD